MSFKAFLEITPKEFYLSLKSKSEYDWKLVEANVKSICNTIRTQTLWLYNPLVIEKYQKTDPKKLMEFPWDKDFYAKTQTPDQMKNIAKIIAGVYNKPKKKK